MLFSLYIYTEAGQLDYCTDIEDVPEHAVLLGRIDMAQEVEIINSNFYARIKVEGMK